MRLYLARYTLRNGTRGVLHVIADSSAGAIVTALDVFGWQMRTCSARPA